MIAEEYYHQVVRNCENKIQELEDEIFTMNSFFKSKSNAIIKKAIRIVEKQLRCFPKEALQFGDDSKLNFFEEVCVMEQEDSLNNYFLISQTIESCCQDAYNELSEDEKFILLHSEYPLYDEKIVDQITQEFLNYCMNYHNKKIDGAFDRRNLIT